MSEEQSQPDRVVGPREQAAIDAGNARMGALPRPTFGDPADAYSNLGIAQLHSAEMFRWQVEVTAARVLDELDAARREVGALGEKGAGI